MKNRTKTATPKPPNGGAIPSPSPSTKKETFPIVGIGASAGGLAAFEAFFSGMPSVTDQLGKFAAGPGMAFVLVQHLAPDHESILTDLVRRYTRMEVFEVEDGMVVRPNCAYIIPPNRDMAFLSGRLHLFEPAAPRGQRLPIDFFFRSLAQEQHERAIGIVLSGTGSDGTLGIRAIKGEGGMVIAQTPGSTEYDGMPRSALLTGLVDYELIPNEMPAQLISYAEHAFGKLEPRSIITTPKIENSMRKIFYLLRDQTGNDFSQYKPSTVLRRITRRMAIHQIDTQDEYVKYLQQTPVEVEALFRDLLIGVTSFFRDKEAFKVIEEQVIPKLLSDKREDMNIRVWSAGCSTGEEAYSIAILLAEQQETAGIGFRVQIFATDIDSSAITLARAGRYPASIAHNLTPERLKRFFTLESDGMTYHINKGLRDMLVFSEQNVIKDPPFSKLDLICCRNLLIYMNTDLQKKLIPIFHYSMKSGGFLFLGTSESIGDFCDLFDAQDRKARVFRRKENYFTLHRSTIGRFLGQSPATNTTYGRPPGNAVPQAKISLRELTEQALLKQVVPVGALVDRHGNILYLHGRMGQYLEPVAGETGESNIIRMVREGLRKDLTMALQRAVQGKTPLDTNGLNVRTTDGVSVVKLAVHAVQPESKSDLPLYLIAIEETPSDPKNTARLTAATGKKPKESERINTLKMELCAKEEYLRSANEELETSNEELKSSNEEMQSVNEELQSSNEEMETSKEELQSVNEELATVNTELQSKVSDLSRVNNDINNLLSGTGIATVFVDHELRIMRFTPMSNEIINLIPGDIGRPVSHIVSNLRGYSSLEADVKSVLETLIPKEQEVQTVNGQWYKLRIMPYRTAENMIEGAVITCLNITDDVRLRELPGTSSKLSRLAVLVRDARDAMTVHDLEGRILAWNPTAERLYGWSENEALDMNVRDRIPPALQADELARVKQLSQSIVLEPFLTQRLTRAGKVLKVSIISTALLDAAGQMYAVATTERAQEDGA